MLQSFPSVTYSPSDGRRREKPGMLKTVTAPFIKKVPENLKRNVKYFFATDFRRAERAPQYISSLFAVLRNHYRGTVKGQAILHLR